MHPSNFKLPCSLLAVSCLPLCGVCVWVMPRSKRATGVRALGVYDPTFVHGIAGRPACSRRRGV